MKRLVILTLALATTSPRTVSADRLGFPDLPYQHWTAGCWAGLEVELKDDATITGVGVVVSGTRSSRTAFRATFALYRNAYSRPVTLAWASEVVDFTCADSSCRLEKPLAPAAIPKGRYFLYFNTSETVAWYVSSTTPVVWSWDSPGWGRAWPKQVSYPRSAIAYPPSLYLFYDKR